MTSDPEPWRRLAIALFLQAADAYSQYPRGDKRHELARQFLASNTPWHELMGIDGRDAVERIIPRLDQMPHLRRRPRSRHPSPEARRQLLANVLARARTTREAAQLAGYAYPSTFVGACRRVGLDPSPIMQRVGPDLLEGPVLEGPV